VHAAEAPGILGDVAGAWLYKPMRGKLQLQTAYMPRTRGWLTETVGARGFKHLDGGNWEIAARHFRRPFIIALADRFGSVVVKNEVHDGRGACVVECSEAKIETVDNCECVCLGDNHGQGDGGWKHVGERLLVRAGVVVLVTTFYGRSANVNGPASRL